MTEHAWDGVDRRLAERRIVQRGPFKEYPKMVDGRTVQSADEEAHLKPKHAPHAHTADGQADSHESWRHPFTTDTHAKPPLGKKK